MSVISDSEFGDIIVRRHHNARRISIKFDTKRRLVATAPRWTPLYIIKKTIDKSRPGIRQIAQSAQVSGQTYSDGMLIGKSHQLALVPHAGELTKSRRQNLLTISYPESKDPASNEVQQFVREQVAKLLRNQSEHYLPRRLEHLASKYGYSYNKVRFSHAGSRWGSCSTAGTISLNIALMTLPHELIDYVLAHELCHTEQMNHSDQFWQLVAEIDPDYQQHRKQLKNHHPTI